MDDNVTDPCDAGSILDDPVVRYSFITVYTIEFLICLFGNVFTLVVIGAHPSMRTATNFFLANLAVADLLVAVFCILQNMIHIFGFENGSWPLGEVLCKMYVLVLHMVPCTSVGILVCVSLEKYIAVLHPLMAMQLLTQRLRVAVTGGIWVVALLTNLVYYFNTRVYVFPPFVACGRAQIDSFWITGSFVVWYVLPLTALGIIYFRIGFLLWSHSAPSLRTGNRQSSDSAGSTGASWQLANGRVVVYKQESLLQVPDEKIQRKKRKEMEARNKVIRLLFAVVSSFAVFTFPHHARLLQNAWFPAPLCTSDVGMLMQPISFLSLFFSSAINPILYAFLSRRFREAVADILHCRKGLFSRMSRSRNRTMVSDLPDDSRQHSPMMIRMNRIR